MVRSLREPWVFTRTAVKTDLLGAANYGFRYFRAQLCEFDYFEAFKFTLRTYVFVYLKFLRLLYICPDVVKRIVLSLRDHALLNDFIVITSLNSFYIYDYPLNIF